MIITWVMFWNFLLDPDLTTIIRQTFWYLNFPALFRVLLLCLLLAGFGAFLSQGMINLHIIPDPGPHILDHNTMSRFQFIVGAVLLAPLAEEFIFRAPLKRFSGMLLFASLMVGLLLSVLLKTYWGLLITLPVFLILFVIYRFTVAGSVTRKFNLWHRLFPWHFHLSSVCFALLHLANYENGAALLPFGLLYTLPQLGIGMVLGFTRMMFGLKYSIVLHSMYNLIFVLLLFIRQ